MLEAFGWGFLAQSSLLIAGIAVCWVTVPTRVVGILGGFGAGAMIAAVSFDLLPEAQVDIEPWQTGIWMMVGVAVFLIADQVVERRFGSAGAGGAMGIVVGSVVDGVPESMILGIQVGTGATISLAQSSLLIAGIAVCWVTVPTAGSRAFRRPRGERLEPATARAALVARRARLRSRRRARLPGDRPDERRPRRPRGGPRCRWPARDAHQLADSVLVRAWRSTCRRGDRPGILLVRHEHLTDAAGLQRTAWPDDRPLTSRSSISSGPGHQLEVRPDLSQPAASAPAR
jgi:hypothetical protein